MDYVTNELNSVSSSFPALSGSTMHFPVGGKVALLTYSDEGNYHLLTFGSPPDNRFTSEFIQAFLQAITYIQNSEDMKPLVTTSSTPKFYSNGLDFKRAISTPGFFPDFYYAMMRAMLEFPWPTVAWVNGHAFAAGFMMAACHDYIVMNPEKGFLCMNELQFGAPLLPPMMSIFRVRYGTQLAHKIALTAHRFTGKQALSDGLVTTLGGKPEVEAIVDKINAFSKSPSYGQIRRELFREVIKDTLNYEKAQKESEDDERRRDAFYQNIVVTYKGKL